MLDYLYVLCYNETGDTVSKCRMSGTIVSKIDKTLKVDVVKHRVSRIYGKLVKYRVGYLVHNPDNAYELGQMIDIEECRPISKRKRFAAVGLTVRG